MMKDNAIFDEDELEAESASHETRDVAAEAADSGTRLDRFLAAHLPEVSRSRLKALIEEGRLAASGTVITDPSHKVKPGQIYSLTLPAPEPARPRPQPMDLAIVYEDDHLLVVNKPAGLVVHPAAGNPDSTLVNALLAHCGDSLSGIGGVRRPGIVHRLDKDTSGLMVVAKNDAAHHALAAQLADRSLFRLYRAVVWGVPSPREGDIEGAIGRSPTNRKKMAVVGRGGKPALTHYRVLKVLAGGAASLVECRLKTGRTHQIRVHMAAKGHPLVGDPLYGRPPTPLLKALSESARQAALGFPRQALHAFLIGFFHPADRKMLEFQADMPDDLLALIRSLEFL